MDYCIMIGTLLLVLSWTGHDALGEGPYDGTWEGRAAPTEACREEAKVVLTIIDGKVTSGSFASKLGSTTNMSGSVAPDGEAKIRYSSRNYEGNLRFQGNTFEGTMRSPCSELRRVKGERRQ